MTLESHIPPHPIAAHRRHVMRLPPPPPDATSSRRGAGRNRNRRRRQRQRRPPVRPAAAAAAAAAALLWWAGTGAAAALLGGTAGRTGGRRLGHGQDLGLGRGLGRGRGLNLAAVLAPWQPRALPPLRAAAAPAGGDADADADADARSDAIDGFVSRAVGAVGDGTFVSFVLRGPRAPRRPGGRRAGGGKARGGGSHGGHDQVQREKERLRGSIKAVHGRLIALQEGGGGGKRRRRRRRESESGGADAAGAGGGRIYLQATTKYHGATDVAQNWSVGSGSGSPSTTDVRGGLGAIFYPAGRGGEERGGEAGRARAGSSSAASEWGTANLLDAGLGIRSAELATAAGTWQLDLARKKPSLRFVGAGVGAGAGAGAGVGAGAGRTSPPGPMSHDRAKNVPLSPSHPFLRRLGVTNEDGRPRPGMASKLRQCQKFVEIVGSLVDAAVSAAGSAPPPSVIRTTDLGCGRGYLTFSLHSYLRDRHEGRRARVISRGVEVRPKLVAETNGIAKGLGEGFDGLAFSEGTIESVLLTNSKEGGRREGEEEDLLDVVIALHACDTATDDALWSAVREKASIIVVAPCCHKEVRRQLDPFMAQAAQKDHVLADVLRHNIYRERIAETATDSIRALLLEIAHYSVSVFEFIGGEHTSKNVMITATKMRKKRSESEVAQLRVRLRQLAALHGVSRQKLAVWMGEPLSDDDGDGPSQRISARGMPPM